MAFGLCFATASIAATQVLQFGLNPQHTSQYNVAAQRMNRIKWSASINENVSGGFAHYGAPLVTAANTVIAMVRTVSDTYDLIAIDGNTGSQKYRIATDYVAPSAAWLIPVQPVLTTGGFGTRLYYPGGGGTLMRLDNPDSNSPGSPTRIVFYDTEANYLANKAAFDAAIAINTPITSDSNGVLFFGTRVTGTAPAPLSTTQSFFVRVDSVAQAANLSFATYTDCFTATGDANVSRVTHACAPALTTDEQTVYIGMKGTSAVTQPYLVSLDATSLAPIAKVLVKDPRNGNNAQMNDISTASPMVAPDGDVYYGVLGNPQTTSRGWLLRFTGDLSTEKTAGAFGWDYTPGVIPASMVPSYTGTSTYLLFCKYNNYVAGDANGINLVAIIDPNATQLDFHSTAPGLVETRQVLTMISPSPDPAYSTMMGAAREWCINACAVDQANGSVYFNDEDGHMYRWNLSSNSLSESIQLNSGVGQPYVPTVIGPDGTLFTLNGGYLYAIGGLDDVSVTVASSQPDVLTVLSGDSITFTATVSGNSGVPTGTVTFEDTTIDSYAPNTVTLATVPLDGSGVATYTSSALDGGAVALGSNLGNHRIKAIYSGDGTYGPGEAKLHQKVHAFATSTAMVPSGDFTVSGNTTFTATVTPIGSATVPTGYVTFFDGALAIAQIPLDGSGVAAYTSTGLSAGSHTINAVYNADTWFAKSQDSDPVTIYGIPVAANNSYGTNAQTLLSIGAPGVLGNDTGPAVSTTLITSPTHAASFTLNANGSFTYTPAAGYTGPDQFKYKAVNPAGSSNTAVVNLTVRAKLSSIALDSPNFPGGAGVTGTVTLVSPAKTGGEKVYLSDNSAYLTATGFVTVPAGSSSAPFSVPSTTPPSSVQGKITADLQNGSNVNKSVTVTLKPHAKAVADTYSVNANGSLSISAPGVLSNDANVFGGTAAVVAGPANAATFALSPSGAVSYTPTAGFIGTDSFTYNVTNGGGTGNTTTVTIKVRAVLAAMTVNNPVTGGNNLTGTVTLVGPAPAGGVTVYFSDTLGALLSEAYTITIPAGFTSKAFAIPTNTVGASASGTLTATLSNGSGVTKTKNVTINP